MQVGPQLECQGCGLPVLLAFATVDGSWRTLTCPACDHEHVWVVHEVRGADGGTSRTWLGSSVE